MTETPPAPLSRHFRSQGLTLHFNDWGNDGAPVLILLHGGRDHGRSWDAMAATLRDRFRVIAPDIRGHGNSEWPTGSSHGLADYVYDLAGLVRLLGHDRVAIAGHSMGGMVSLMFTGTFPQRVSALAVLDGVTVGPGRTPRPIYERMTDWIDQLDGIAARRRKPIPTLAQAAERMRANNRRLSDDVALHLATHAVRRNPDGTYVWKFDPYQQARAPYRLSYEDHRDLWARISCPTLFLTPEETHLPDPQIAAGVMRNARCVSVPGTGHWLHHDRLPEVSALLRNFFVAATPAVT